MGQYDYWVCVREQCRERDASGHLSPRHPLPAPPGRVLLVGTQPDSAILLRENIRLLVIPGEDERGQLEVRVPRGGVGMGGRVLRTFPSQRWILSPQSSQEPFANT